MKELTKTEVEYLQFIHDYQNEHGISPSCPTIGNHFSVHRQTALDRVINIEKKGAIKRIKGTIAIDAV